LVRVIIFYELSYLQKKIVYKKNVFIEKVFLKSNDSEQAKEVETKKKILEFSLFF